MEAVNSDKIPSQQSEKKMQKQKKRFCRTAKGENKKSTPLHSNAHTADLSTSSDNYAPIDAAVAPSTAAAAAAADLPSTSSNQPSTPIYTI